MASGTSTVVWKFELCLGAEPGWETINAPSGAQIVNVGQQNDVPCVWALADVNEQETEPIEVAAVPTGYALEGHHLYLGTAHLHNGRIVVHVFQRLPEIPEPPAVARGDGDEGSGV